MLGAANVPLIRVAFMGQMWLLRVLVAFGLAGCGGADPAEGRLSAFSTPCTVAENRDTCSMAVTWTSQRAVELSLQALPEAARAVGPAGTAQVEVRLRGTTVVLADGGQVLATVSLAAACASDTEQDERGYCVAKTLRYTDKVYAEYFSPNGYPRVVTADSATKVANATRYPADRFSIDKCRLKPAPDPSGRIGVSCAVTAMVDGPGPTSILRKFYIDPVADELRDGEDGEPAAEAYGGGTSPAIPADLAPYYRQTTFLDLRFEYVSGKFVVLDNTVGSSYIYLTSVANGHFLADALRGSLYFVAKGSVLARPLSDDLERVICRTCALFPAKVQTYAN